jgi:hypothetical protein
MKNAKNNVMKRRGLGWGMFVLCAGLGAWAAAEDTSPFGGGLGAVEYRALLAQSLTQQIEEMKGEADGLRRELAEKDAQLKEVYETLAQSRREADKLRQHIADTEKQMEEQQLLLTVFRRGSFEYYEVREGDTLRSIAANPMVYGDGERETWLRQANTLPDNEALVPGMVLVIPRFPEGISYEL